MLLLNEGRRPLLDFLRNLTPQALLVSTAIVLADDLDFRRVDFGNWFQTGAVFLCAAFALLAFFANMDLFIDGLLDGLASYSRVARRLRRRGVAPRAATLATLRMIFRQRPTLFLDYVATVTLLNVAWVAIALAAISASRAALR
ncbi:MAG TPA: hypothetical protein VFE82_09135 [Ramlibacter sp.]|jgi:hypothetical protein|uniref:hypothetical protein n=1 Tax=Ramlibacter sp. TaxID=1917967 RepID=UPI002D72DEE1|nr:hypothetical protein [Ramlibacter sp.]HZY18634.1 hypothetical protein [Ramlibacter sp.]